MCTFNVIFYELNLFSNEFGWFPRCVVYMRVPYIVQLHAAGSNNFAVTSNERSLVRSFAEKSLSSVENVINELWWCSKWKWNWISFERVTVIATAWPLLSDLQFKMKVECWMEGGGDCMQRLIQIANCSFHSLQQLIASSSY